MLDENVMIWAMAGGHVENYQRVDDDDEGAFELVSAIWSKGHRIAMSEELRSKCHHHGIRLQQSGVSVTVPMLKFITVGVWFPHLAEYVTEPPEAGQLDAFPWKDRYLAHLALATGAALVTEDGGVHDAAAEGNLGFEVLRIREAIERARTSA